MIRRFIVALALLASLACNPGLERHERPVVNIDGTKLTHGELEAYLTMNLAAVEESENGDAEEIEQGHLVRSRLLDTWIDERLVLFEAAERRLTIDDEQLDEQLDDPAYESGEGDRPSQRAYLRNRLLIELVQSQVLHDVAPPTSEETVAWLDENSDRPIAGRKVLNKILHYSYRMWLCYFGHFCVSLCCLRRFPCPVCPRPNILADINLPTNFATTVTFWHYQRFPSI